MKIVHDPVNMQINFLDERFYTLDGVTFYPSVTTVLDVYPKGFGFNQWLKDLGVNADEAVRRAAESGAKIHDAIDKYLNGERVLWVSPTGEKNYSFDEWVMIQKFVEFWERYTPKKIANEVQLVSSSMRIGGTIDLICELNGEIWLIDYKTTNAIHTTHELQLSSYRKMWNEKHPEYTIARAGIIWLKALTRGEDKKGKTIQGAGWCLREFERNWEDAYRLFDHVRAIWDEENPNYKPKNKIYPDFIMLPSSTEGEL